MPRAEVTKIIYHKKNRRGHIFLIGPRRILISIKFFLPKLKNMFIMIEKIHADLLGE
jgi:hypothetical protein